VVERGIPLSTAVRPEPPAPPQEPAAAPAPGPPPGGPQAGGSGFQPPYESVKPADLALLERFIHAHNKRQPENVRRYIGAEIIRVASAFGMRWEFLAAVIRAESDFDPLCVSGSGAQGLGQLMPGTARLVGCANPFEIRANLQGAATYMRTQLDRYRDRDPGTQFALALACYNAGPGAVDKHGGVPPYAETNAYIRKILGDYLQLCRESAAGR
jgi:soluble lytic murein transglycosylase-like protein